jgi:hypothetical protein
MCESALRGHESRPEKAIKIGRESQTQLVNIKGPAEKPDGS